MTVGDKVRDPKSVQAMDVTSPSGGLVRGAFYYAQDTYGIIYQALSTGEIGSLIFKCNKILLPKATGSGYSVAIGDVLYLNTTTLVVSTTQGAGDIPVGIALETATISDTTVMAYLDTAMGETKVQAITIQIPDVSTAQSAFATAHIAGTITKIYTIINGTIATADAGISSEINGTAITDGGITVAYSGSASGDQDSATPSALNVLALGDKLEAITDGASTNAVGCFVTYLVQVGG